MKNRCYSRY